MDVIKTYVVRYRNAEERGYAAIDALDEQSARARFEEEYGFEVLGISEMEGD